MNPAESSLAPREHQPIQPSRPIWTESVCVIETREFGFFRNRAFTLPADTLLIHCFLATQFGLIGNLNNGWMTLFLITKLAVLLALIAASVPTGAIQGFQFGPGEASQAAPIQVAPEPYFWKLATPEWKIPDANFATNYAADFVAPQSEYGAGHRGIDFRSGIGVNVRSPATGQVVEAQVVGYRSVITVKDAKGRLATMEPVCASVKLGAQVYAGQVIARTCTPQPLYVWHCSNCVHLSARIEGQYVSPLLLMGLFKPSVIKPFS